jgi:hypothetical protein
MTEPLTPDALRERIAQQEANLVNIVAQTLIADDGNWRDVLDNIRHMAEGRFDSASPSILADSNRRIATLEAQHATDIALVVEAQAVLADLR